MSACVDDYECGACGGDLCQGTGLMLSTGTLAAWDCISCGKYYDPTTLKQFFAGPVTFNAVLKASAAQPATQAPGMHTKRWYASGHEYECVAGQTIASCKLCKVNALVYDLDGFVSGVIKTWHQCPASMVMPPPPPPYPPNLAATVWQDGHEFEYGITSSGKNVYVCKGCRQDTTPSVLSAVVAHNVKSAFNPCPTPRATPSQPAPVPATNSLQQTLSTFNHILKQVYGGWSPPSSGTRIQAAYHENLHKVLGHTFVRCNNKRAWYCGDCKTEVADDGLVMESCPGAVDEEVCVDCDRELCDALDWSPSTERWSMERCAPCRTKYERSGRMEAGQ